MNMRPILLAAALAAIASAPNAVAETQSRSRAAVQGVRLDRLCSDCAVVTSVKRETQKGKGSGAGAIGGAVAGGVVGNKTTDSTIGTVGGAAVGGLLGNEIEKRVKKEKVWVTRVTFRDGSTRKFASQSEPAWSAGSVVEVDDGRLKRH